jgi:hypothetical protein
MDLDQMFAGTTISELEATVDKMLSQKPDRAATMLELEAAQDWILEAQGAMMIRRMRELGML